MRARREPLGDGQPDRGSASVRPAQPETVAVAVVVDVVHVQVVRVLVFLLPLVSPVLMVLDANRDQREEY